MDQPSLRDVQRWMKRQIQPSADASLLSAGVELLNPQRGTPGTARLAVYAEGYVARLREALAEVYEAVHHIVGERAFTALTERYAAQHPSHDYNLSFAGRHLPEFLGGDPLTERLPFLPDLAALEWRICCAFHAFEERPLHPAHVTSLTLEAWDHTRLLFQPSVGVVVSAWPIRDIWEARRQPRETVDLPVAGRQQCVLVCRQGEQVACHVIEAGEGDLLKDLLAGRTLGDACERLAAGTGGADGALPAPPAIAPGGPGSGVEGPPPIAEWMRGWLERGLLTGYELTAVAGARGT